MRIKIVFIVFGISLMGCVESFDFQSESIFEDTFVIEATITDEMKKQEILLSRAYSFETDSIEFERNARVSIIDDTGGEFTFTESEPGTYLSDEIFAAENGREYRLNVTTDDGESYSSEMMGLAGQSELESVYAEKDVSDTGAEGISILIDASETSGEAKFYRYEYEETFKIVAPNWSPADFVIISDVPPFEVGTEQRMQEERVCYGFNPASEIIQASTSDLSENKLSRFPIKFISEENYIIAHRYSILVKQLVQTPEAFEYYRLQNQLSLSESVFFENQPGFLQGNIFSDTDNDEKIIGYFEVASVSSKRLFLDYEEFFESDGPRPFPFNCRTLGAPLLSVGSPPKSPLIQAIKAGLIKHVGTNNGTFENGGPFLTTKAECGDCTRLGSNVVPDFWVE